MPREAWRSAGGRRADGAKAASEILRPNQRLAGAPDRKDSDLVADDSEERSIGEPALRTKKKLAKLQRELGTFGRQRPRMRIHFEPQKSFQEAVVPALRRFGRSGS